MPQSNVYNSELYRYSISKGDIEGSSPILIRGVNTNMSNSVAQTIWNQGGDYVYLTSETPLYLSSSSANDVGNTFIVDILDSNFNQFSYEVTLNGQNQVLVANNCFRNNDVRLSSGGFLEGEVYLAEADTLSGGVPTDTSKIKDKVSFSQLAGESGEYASASVSWSAVYTVPRGKMLLLDRYYATGTGSEGTLTGRFRPAGETFWTSRNEVPIVGNQSNEVFSPPVAVSAGTDFQTRGTGGNNQTQSIRYEGVLIDD